MMIQYKSIKILPHCAVNAGKLLLLVTITLFHVACVTESKSLITEPTSDLTAKAKAHTELAASYINLGKYEIAQQELEKALAADSRYSGTHFVAGVLALKLGVPKEAEKEFRIAAKDTNNSVASHELGVLLCRTGRVKESMQYFDQAINNPLFTRRGISNLRAGECIAKQNTKRAQQYFSAALAEDPTLSITLYRLAETFYAENKLLRARAYLERFKSATGDSPQTLFLGYQIESKAKSKKSADEYSEQLLKKFPGSYEAKSLRKLLEVRG